MTEPVSNARYFPWDGGAIFVGTAGVLPAHAHQAVQLCFLFEGHIRLRPGNSGRWTGYDMGLVPSRHIHSMDGQHTRLGATIFVEPETREGRILAERLVRAGITELDRAPVEPVIRDLRSAVHGGSARLPIVEIARRLVHGLTQHVEPSVTCDERILRAIRYINERLAAPLTLREVASVACLSPGRFRHLFAAQTGMGLRQYILWRRFVSVWELRMSGASLSTAAHAAGFADSAHLARTSRRMFGIPPSALDVSASPG